MKAQSRASGLMLIVILAATYSAAGTPNLEDQNRKLAAKVGKAKTEPPATWRFVEQAGGTVVDKQSRLAWTQSDNGADIDWNGAHQWCEQKGGGWQLPSADELVSLFDVSGELRTTCGSYTCIVSPAFRLTGPVFWSRDREGSSIAWGVRLNSSIRYKYDVGGTAFLKRALCVRRS